jgi:hypothetical protein
VFYFCHDCNDKKRPFAALGFSVAGRRYRLERAKGHTPANSAFLDAFGAHFGRGPRDPQPEPAPEPPTT